MRSSILAMGFGAILVAPLPSAAAPLTLVYDSYVETKFLTTGLDATTPIRLDGLLPDRGGAAISNQLTFRAGSSSLSLGAGWLIAPNAVRTIGVNIDIFDAQTNILVASDAFLGTAGALASSSLTASGLVTGGLYRLVMTGTAIQGGRYQIDLVDGASPPPLPSAPAVPTSTSQALFDTRVGAKTPGGSFAPGDELQIDGILTESGSISDDVNLTVTSSTLSAGIAWLVAPGPLRTTGVNVDLFDANDVLVASDAFVGVTDGQAFSQFSVGSLVPGNYMLRFTGNALDGGRYRINLTTDPDAPGFVPIPLDAEPSDVPEPGSLLLLLAGVAGLVARTRAAQGDFRPMM